MEKGYTLEWLKGLLRFPFQDPEWRQKLLIGSLLMLPTYLLPLIPPLYVYGYFYEIMCRIIIDGEAASLPEWDLWGKKFRYGLRFWLLSLIFMLPMLCAILAASFVVFSIFPFSPDLAWESSLGPDFIPWLTRLSLSSVLIISMSGVIMPFTTVIGFFMHAMQGHIVATDSLAGAFRFKEWWKIFRANVLGYVIAFLVMMGLGFVLVMAVQVFSLTLVFICLMPFVLSPVGVYLLIISGALYGEAYRVGKLKSVQDQSLAVEKDES